MRRLKIALRLLLAVAMVVVGVLHFVNPAGFVRIVPAYLPAPLALVLVSGAAEILGGLGLFVPRTRRLAAWGLVALYIAVFPANLNMALHQIPLGDAPIAPDKVWLLWLRLPFQALFIAWAVWLTRPDPPEKPA
ncbi:MAG: DoxX family membrane protein [Byssovorax sp.]